MLIRSFMTGAVVRLLRAGRLAVALAILCPGSALALHRESPPAVRLSSGGPHFVPSTRSWSFKLAFSSPDDLLGNGSTGRQIYVFNQFQYDCQRGIVTPTQVPCPNPPIPFLQQITYGPGDADNPTIDGAGTHIAFDADGVYRRGKGAGHRQIFELDLETGELLQITTATDGDSIRPSFNSFGRVIVFESTAALKGGTSGVPQVFAFLRITVQHIPIADFLQITNGAGPSTRPMLDFFGSFITFESTADLLGDGHDTGVSQIFVSQLDKVFPFASRLVQITRGDAPSHHPWISDSDHIVLFDSAATDLPGAIGGGGTQIYAAPTTSGNQPPVTQYTTANPFGDCTFPTFSPAVTRFAFLCTGDPFGNGTTGNRVFAFDAITNQLFQITGRGNVVGPISASVGINFVAISDNADISGSAACDQQIYIIDYYPFPGHWHAATKPGELPQDVSPLPPPKALDFSILPADGLGGGSQATLTTQYGASIVGMAEGFVRLDIAPADIHEDASISVPGVNVILPPIPFPGYGAFCVAVPRDGSGVFDCDGGRAGGDLSSFMDHDIDNNGTDPVCTSGCREDAPCQGPLPGPHRNLALANPPYPPPGVCNGLLINRRPGTFAPGGMQLSIPVTVTLSEDIGLDGVWCTGDDNFFFRDAPSTLALTTGAADGAILDTGDVAGAMLGATDHGAAFDCARVQAGDLTGGELVGAILLLDVPNPGLLTDMILGLHLVAAPGICLDCTCSATACGAAADCIDTDLCNGTEQCLNLTCVPGVPLPCDDGNPCTDDSCDPTAGCIHTNNTGPCNDGNPCTTSDTCQSGTCVGVAGANGNLCDDGDACTLGDVCQAGACSGTPAPDGTLCDDGSPCTTGDTCLIGTCTGGPALPDTTPCPDGSLCNGLETCVGGVCTPGTGLGCDDGNSCTVDACDPITGCRNITSPDGTPCYDGNGCTQTDVCQTGTCVGSDPIVCPVAQCSNAGCDPSNGTCSATQLPDGASCEDGAACTTGDTCLAGTCTGGNPVVCAPLDSCHLAGICDPANGCSNPAKANGTACDDGSACTLSEVCLSGACTGVFVSCDDGDPCNGTETCDPASGSCLTGPPPNCDDGDPCTSDKCPAFTGCTHLSLGAFACGLGGIEQTFALLQQDIQAAPVTSLGGQTRQTRLLGLVSRGLARIQSARTSPTRLRAQQLHLIQLKLKSFTSVLDAGMRRLSIEPTLGATLRSLAVGAMRDLQSLRASVA